MDLDADGSLAADLNSVQHTGSDGVWCPLRGNLAGISDLNGPRGGGYSTDHLDAA
ncbi:hypothetical protein [Nocardia terpenica]|uniref:hypothetical protein n=1 Tax=Nocardia terpenica TaxID=455432 RepID=UPI0012FDAEF6|nr:hypothetical protein [Nocardia terpenica]